MQTLWKPQTTHPGKSATWLLPAQPCNVNEDRMWAVTTHVTSTGQSRSHRGGLPQCAPLKVNTTNNSTHFTALKRHCVIYSTTICALHLFWLSSVSSLTGPNKSKSRCFTACHVSFPSVNSALFCFYANLTGRHKMLSSGWTVRKEVGSSDSLSRCKNRSRTNRSPGFVEALKLHCHYASWASWLRGDNAYRPEKNVQLQKHNCSHILAVKYSAMSACFIVLWDDFLL